MSDPRPQPPVRPSAAPAAKPAAQQQTGVRHGRPEPEDVVSLIAEAERIMGVKPLTGRLRPLPGY